MRLRLEQTQMSQKYTTYGPVRGLGPIRTSIDAAQRDLKNDQYGCYRGCGGYSDRRVYAIDADGYLVDDFGRFVYPSHGKSMGAVRAIKYVREIDADGYYT